MKRQIQNVKKKALTYHTPDKELISRVYKEFLNSTVKKEFTKWEETWIGISQQEFTDGK